MPVDSRTDILPGGTSVSPGILDRPLLVQAGAMVLTRAGLASMAIVDAYMVAQVGGGELAAVTLADGTFGRLIDVAIAVVHSALVLAAGAGALVVARRIAVWHRSMAAAFAMGLAGLVVSVFAAPILAGLGLDQALVDHASTVILVLGLGLPAGLVALASAVHLEAIGRAGLAARWMVAANLLNIALNWLLIGGNLGFPALGAVGSAAATSLVRVALALALVAAVRGVEGPAAFRRGEGGGPLVREQWTLGLGAAGTSGCLHLLGVWLTIFAGWLGALPLAAYAAGWVINMPGLLIAMGIGDAIALRVAAGGRSPGTTRRLQGDLTVVVASGRSAAIARRLRGDLAVLALVLAPFALGLAAAPALVAGLFTPDPTLAALMAGLLPLSAVVLVLDGLSYGLIAALRGARDVVVPVAIQIAGMAATPAIAAALAFWAGFGVTGLVVAILATSGLRLALLAARSVHVFARGATLSMERGSLPA